MSPAEKWTVRVLAFIVLTSSLMSTAAVHVGDF